MNNLQENGRYAVDAFGKRMPPWLKKRICSQTAQGTEDIIKKHELNTVCSEAACPNRNECYSSGTATFMILGDTCTRNCVFCNVAGGSPKEPDAAEPVRVAEAAKSMGLAYCVVTSVTRDDLNDGGSEIFAETITKVREIAKCPVEVLIPDFQGDQHSIQTVIEAAPEVFNHNVETVPRLYPEVRPEAQFSRSLAVLKQAADAGLVAKSGVMVGMGETDDELFKVFDELAGVGCSLLTLGQYLRPGTRNLPVREYVHPDLFDILKAEALQRGLKGVASGPFVRSSHHARELYEELQNVS